MIVGIKTEPNLVRDTTNRAILNTDIEGLKKYQAQRKLALERLNEQEEVKNKVNKLEEDIGEIKSMIQNLLQMRKSNGN